MLRAWRRLGWGGLLALALAIAPPAAGQNPELRRTAEQLEAEVQASCAGEDLTLGLVRRVDALRMAAGPRPAWLYAAAPTALQWAARRQRLEGDLAAARTSYQAWLDMAPRNHRDRAMMVKERAGLEAESQLRAAGIDPPARQAFAWESRPLMLADGRRAVAVVWVSAHCRVIAPGEAASLLLVYEAALPATVGRRLGAALEFPDELVSFAPERPLAYLMGDGTPVLVLRAANGGQCWGCNRLRLVAAGSGGPDELPVGDDASIVPFAIEDVGRDGRLAVLASDSRWEGFAGLCPSCAPVPTLVYRWRQGHLAETCREESAFYERETVNAEALLGQETLADYALGQAIALLLNRLQQGEDAPAWESFVGDLGRLREMPGASQATIEAATRDLRRALDRAGAGLTQRGCPVLGLELP